MRGIRINFNGSTASLNFTDPLEGKFDCMVQNAVVGVAVDKGSDYMYPTKGTELFKEAVSGGIFSDASMRHAANYAASETKRFTNNNLPAGQEETMRDFVLEPEALDSEGKLRLIVRSTSSLGNSSTLTWDI